MEGLLHELVKESDNLESILKNRVPKGSDFALQWTLNRVVKKKVEHVTDVIENVINRLYIILSARNDVADPITTQELAVQTLHNLRRKIDYSLKLANHSGIDISFKEPGQKVTLFQRVLDSMRPSSNPEGLKSSIRPDVDYLGPNFNWLFTPLIRAIHKLSDTEPITYTSRQKELATTYKCRGLTCKDCLEYVQFCKAWYAEEKPFILSPYSDEIDAIERVYAGEEDAWGYELKKSVKATLFKISEPAPLRRLNRGPGGSASHRSMSTDPVRLIETKEALTETIADLLVQEPLHSGHLPVLAIDVEFSAKASYRGQVSLIQISTPQADYIIDPFAINDYWAMHELNQITANPGILKVMHGLDHDIEWLQQHFGIFLVNVFDTFRAAKELRISGGFSLYNAVLLYGQIALDKSQQMSDWRIRPLTIAQLQYAREDTRYLLNIFGRMRNQILSMTNQPHQWKGVDESGQRATHLGRKVMLNVLHTTQQVAAQVVSWAPINISAKLDRLHEVTSGRVPITHALRSSAEVLFAFKDLRARALDQPSSSICPDGPLYQAVVHTFNTPNDLKNDLPKVPSDALEQFQILLQECSTIFKDSNEHTILSTARKRLRPASMNTGATEKKILPEAAPAATVVEPGLKRRKLFMTEVDRIKSESADDGAISAINDLALDGSGDVHEDIEVIIRGFYQAGAGKVACFEKKGNQTSKSIKELGSEPPWLCVLDSTILSRV